MHPIWSIFIALIFVLPLRLRCMAYIPAVPVNDTSGLNFSDSSTISISWTDPAGVYSGAVSYQLRADVATGGTTSGALVHFSESTMGENLTTSTPWIAYISCDVNETNASQEWDIFTLARDRGAVSALLYTAQSTSCLLNWEYITEFEKPLDVFATKTVQVARVIDNQFTHTNDSYDNYNGTLLNSSGTAVNDSLSGNAPTTKTYLSGTLTARNSTGQATATSIPGATTSASPSSSSKKTSAPMIVLYTITGIVSSMFILMLLIGARRAMMHPERYGRREGDETQGPQSTAGGLAQAILDTFPIIRYNRQNDHFSGRSPKRLSSENNLQAYTMPGIRERRSSLVDLSQSNGDNMGEEGDYESTHSHERKFGENAMACGSGSGSSRASEHRQSTAVPPPGEEDTDMSQCPICLLDFEEGDDLRVLPCEKEHMYHKACIDPWLLNVSSSCPLCRRDFNNPQPPPTSATSTEFPPSTTHPNSSESVIANRTQTHTPESTADPPTHSGFARYLAFMRRERRPRTRSRTTEDSGVGSGRRREADQSGPGGY